MAEQDQLQSLHLSRTGLLKHMTPGQMNEFWQKMDSKLAAKLNSSNSNRKFILSTVPDGRGGDSSDQREVLATVSCSKYKGSRMRLFLFDNAVFLTSNSTVHTGYELPYTWTLDSVDQAKMSNQLRSFSVVFPEDTITVTCTCLEGKEKLMWNIVHATMEIMNFDLQGPMTRNIETCLQDLKTREGIAYTFVEKSHPFCDAKYSGKWHKGKPFGGGELMGKDGMRYTGEFFNGLFHGNGHLSFPKNSQSDLPQPMEYHGDFEKGKYHGYGDMKYSNSDIYEGWWKEGNRHGYGRYEERRVDRRAVYFGGWENDKRSGYGVGEDKIKLHRYMGMWSNDVHHGFGILVLSDGTYCETKFSQGDIEDGEEGYILSVIGHSFRGKIGPGLKLCGRGTLSFCSGSKLLSYTRGSFSGEWGKSVAVKSGEVHGLFPQAQPGAQQLRTRPDSLLSSVDNQIGFCSVKASEKWIPLVEVYKQKMGFTPTGRRERRESGPRKDAYRLVESLPASSSTSASDHDDMTSSHHVQMGTPANIKRPASLAPNGDHFRQTPLHLLKAESLFDNDDPLCHMMNKLAAVFHESYSGLGTTKVLLPHAINETKEMIRHMHALIRCLYPHLHGDHHLLGPHGTRHSGREDRNNDWVDIDSGYSTIQPFVFERIFPTLFSLYVLHNEDQDSKYRRGVLILNRLGDAQLAMNLSMPQDLVDQLRDGRQDNPLMQLLTECAKSLEVIKAIFTPIEILRQFQDVFSKIATFSKAGSGMDTMLPLAIMAVVRAKFPRLGAYVHFLFDFVTEQSRVPNNQDGYIMTTFESIYSHITIEAERWPSDDI